MIRAVAEIIPEQLRARDDVRLGIGDDAAVWRPPAGRDLVVTTDTMVEQVHFRLDWTDWRSLGHKLLAVNVSDIAAMGGRPDAATVTLGLRGNERVDDVLELYRGMIGLAEAHGIALIGGDVVRSPEAVTLGLTLLGSIVQEMAVTRSGARAGDLIAVSGTLGAAAAGMALLDDLALRSSATTADLLVAAHLRPNPRVALGQALAGVGVTAMMDLSDGLLGDLPKIAAASRVNMHIEQARIPVAPAIRALFPERWQQLAQQGGEDYELLMTIGPDRWEEAVNAATDVEGTLTVIGEVSEAGDGRVEITTQSGASLSMTGAFDHFSNEDSRSGS